jgi:hypothetical protein
VSSTSDSLWPPWSEPETDIRKNVALGPYCRVFNQKMSVEMKQVFGGQLDFQPDLVDYSCASGSAWAAFGIDPTAVS